jgi:hypothetical protein
MIFSLFTLWACLAVAFVIREKHPHDFVLPVRRFVPLATTILPQSHLHSHRLLRFELFPIHFRTVNLPKRWPIKFSAVGPVETQPQDVLCPLRRAPVLALVLPPQSQRQSHCRWPWRFLFLLSPIAVSLPNRCPVRLTR